MARIRKWLSSGILAALMALAAIVLFPLLDPSLSDLAGSEAEFPRPAAVPARAPVPASSPVPAHQRAAPPSLATSPAISDTASAVQAPRRVEGVVMSPEGIFISNAAIVYGPGPDMRLGLLPALAVAHTNDRGHFLLENIPADVTEITAMHEDYLPTTIPLEIAETLVIRLGIPARVEGRVTWAGEPLPGASVWLHPIEGAAPSQEALTDAEGRFVIPKALPGTASLAVSATPKGYHITDELELNLLAGEIHHVNFALGESACALEGYLINFPAGLPGSSVSIRISPATGGEIAVRPDDSGYYLAEGLAPGAAQVRLTHGITSGSEFALSAEVYLTDQQRTRHDFDFETVTVVEGQFTGIGENEMGLVFLMPPGVSVPQTHEELQALDGDGMDQLQTVLHQDGSYHLLVEGTAPVTIIAVALRMDQDKAFRFAATEVDPAGATEYIDFDLSP